MLQQLLGAYTTPKGKKYRLIAPILFLDETERNKDIFLNPALVKVSILFYQTFVMIPTDK